MRELPFDLRFERRRPAVHLVHGSPRKVNEYLFEDKPARLYERLAGAETRDVLVFGHTHKPWVHEYGGVLFVNCGSVGKPKDGDPRGAFAVLEPRATRRGHDRARRVRRPSGRRRGRAAGLPASSPTSSSPRHDRHRSPRRLFAEFLGSAFLAALVIGSGIAAQQLSPDDTGLELLENAAATAAGLFAIILMFGPVSGGHFNPVVSLVDAHFGGLSRRDALAYIPAQIAGCITGAVARQRDVRARRDQHLHPPPRQPARTCSPRSSPRSGCCW